MRLIRLTGSESKVESMIFYFSNFLSNSLILFYLKVASLSLITLNTTSFLILTFISFYIKVLLKDSKYKENIDEGSSNSLLSKES